MNAEHKDFRQHDTATHTCLRGPWLFAARLAWIAVAVFALVAWSAAVTVDYGLLRTWDFTAAEIRVLQFLGFSTGVFPLYTEAMRGLRVLLHFAIASMLFWRRSNDRGMFLISLSLALSGLASPWILWSVTVETPLVLRLSQLALFLGYASLGLLPLIFPNGRFVPRWTRWVFLAALPWLAASILFPKAQYSLHAQGESISLLVQFFFFSIFIFSQVYRYRHVSTPVQRQQTKWVMFGFIAMFTMISTLVLLQNTVPPLTDRTNLPGAVYEMYLAQPLWAITWMIVPVTIGISMLRYRLWDIDFVINRSLVYGGLTIVLLAVFFGAFFGLQAIVEAILGSEQMAAVLTISAAVVFGLFMPTRDRLRRFVDRRFYGIELDYGRAAREHSARVDAKQPQIAGKIQFGSYTDLELLGRGGMAEVYRGRRQMSNDDVAIKILAERLMDDESVRKRFYREAQTIARLKHPNIVKMHDFGDLEGVPYMVMEYVEGQELGELLRVRGRLPVDEALPLLQDIASALDYAHDNGVVHRDIKPSNVIVAPVPASAVNRTHRAILMDFGIAKLYATLTQLTETGRMVGTLSYIAPEQIKGASEVDRRADLYSFGVMTYQILTGQLPFKHNNPGAMVMAHLVQLPPDPREVVPDLPREVAEAIMRAMAKDPDTRHGTVGEFVDRLEIAQSLHRTRPDVMSD